MKNRTRKRQLSQSRKLPAQFVKDTLRALAEARAGKLMPYKSLSRRGWVKYSKGIDVANLPNFDAAPYLNSEVSIAAYLTEILEANDASLLTAALADIARARRMTEIAKPAIGDA
jgi:hypothetical protein